MKISTKLSVISAVGALALVGTAFAAWQFNQQASLAANANVTITAKSDAAGSVAINPSSFSLELDQAALSWKDTSGVITSVEMTYTGSEGNADVSDIVLSASYVVDSALDDYISVTGGSLGSATASSNVKSATYTLPALAWKDGMKPNTEAEYNAMVSALSGAKVAFTFSANFAS